MKLKNLVAASALFVGLIAGYAYAEAPPTEAPTRELKTLPGVAIDADDGGHLFVATGPSNAQKALMLNYFLGIGTQTTVYLAAFTVMPADDGTGGTEVTGSAYARVSITDNSTNFPTVTAANPALLKLATAESFPAATADWMSGVNVAGFGFYSASTSGTFLCSLYALSTPALCTVDPTTDVFANPGTNGFAANDAVRFVISSGATIPAPLSASTTYYIIATSLSSTAFKIAATQGGSAIDITTYIIAGTLRVFKSYVGPVLNGTTLTIPSNQLQIQLQGF